MLKGGSNAEIARSAQNAKFGARILDMAHRLAELSETASGLTCTFFSPAHQATASQLREWMHSAGLRVEIDVIGNVIGRYQSPVTAAKAVIIGSHYDTVANAGQFDGRLGILTGIIVTEHLHRLGWRLPFDVDVVAFAEEEGVRFSAPYLGSSAIAGRFEEATLQRRDGNGIRLAEVLGHNGFTAVQSLARPKETLRGYLEVHIEQGPVLLQRDLPVGSCGHCPDAAAARRRRRSR